MLAHSDIAPDLIKEAIKMAVYEGPFQMVQVEFDHIIGKINVVEVQPGQEVKMMKRRGRNTLSPVVKSPKVATSKMVIGICDDPDDGGKPTMFTAFLGELAPKKLSDPRLREDERAEAEAYWTTHAFVYDPELFEAE